MRSRFPSSLALATCVLATGVFSASCDAPFTAPVIPEQTSPQPAAASAIGGFKIELRYLGDVPDDVRAAASAAATKWMQVVTGPVLPVQIDQTTTTCGFGPLLAERVPGVIVFVRMSSPDALVTAAADGGSCGLRQGTLISYEGAITVSTPGLKNSRAARYLDTIFLHELGHVLGIGTNWFQSPYLHDASGPNPRFLGPRAMQAAFDVGASASRTTPVPVSHSGESGAYTHWRTPALGNDIMLSGGGTALTIVSAAALEDMGYTISRTALDPYVAH